MALTKGLLSHLLPPTTPRYDKRNYARPDHFHFSYNQTFQSPVTHLLLLGKIFSLPNISKKFTTLQFPILFPLAHHLCLKTMSSTPTPLPTKIGILIFPGFQLLDYAGPLDALNILSYTYPLSLYTIASSLSPVSTQTSSGTERGSAFAQCVIPTHTFETAPRDLDVVIVPGGLGMRGEGMEERMRGVGEWLEGMVGEDGEGIGKEGVRWILTICTGSEILARTGVLDGRRATTNKRAFNEVCFYFSSLTFSFCCLLF